MIQGILSNFSFSKPRFAARVGSGQADEGGHNPKKKKRATKGHKSRNPSIKPIRPPSSKKTTKKLAVRPKSPNKDSGLLTVSPEQLAQIVMAMHAGGLVEQAKQPVVSLLKPSQQKAYISETALATLQQTEQRLATTIANQEKLGVFRDYLGAIGNLVLSSIPRMHNVFGSIDAFKYGVNDFATHDILPDRIASPKKGERRKQFIGTTTAAALMLWDSYPKSYANYHRQLRRVYPEVFEGKKATQFFKQIESMESVALLDKFDGFPLPLHPLKPSEAQNAFDNFMKWLTPNVYESPKQVLASLPQCIGILMALKKQGANFSKPVLDTELDKNRLIIPGAEWHYPIMLQPYRYSKKTWETAIPKHQGPEVLAAAALLSRNLADIGEFTIDVLPTWAEVRYVKQTKYPKFRPSTTPFSELVIEDEE